MPAKIKNKTVAARPTPPSRSAPIIERAPLPIVEVQGETHIVSYVNSAFCSLLEKSREELLGKTFSEIVPGGNECVSILDRVYQTGEAANLALKDPSEQTPAHWLYAMWPVVDETQLPVGVIIQLTKATNFSQNVTAINEALLLSGLLQHEMRETAEKLNAQLQTESAEHKVANEALRESEEKFRSMVESSRDCIKELDLEGRLLSMNGVGQCLFEIDDLTPFLHRPWKEFWKSDSAVAQQAVETAMSGGVGKFEGACETVKGNNKWWSVVVTPIVNAAGQPARLLVVSRDITDRRLAEEKLHESELKTERARDYAEATLRTAPIPLLVLRANLRVNTANEAFYKNFQVEPGETEGQLIYDLGNAQWNIPKLRELLEEILPKDNFFNNLEITHEFESIGRRTMLLNARRMVNQTGRPQKIVLAIEDITERKLVEEALAESKVRLDFALQSARIGDWDLDLVTDRARRSLRHDEAFGYTQPVAEWGFEKFISHVHPADREDMRDKFKQAVSKQKEWHIECRVIWPDGSIHWVAVHGSIYRLVDGQPRNMLGIVTDITWSKLAQEKVWQHSRELELRVSERTADLNDTNEQLAAFVYSIAHDLRAPLRSMQGFSQILLDDYAPSLDKTAGDYLKRINASSEFMDKMIIDLLAFGRVGRTETKLEPVKVQLVWDSAIYQYATQIEQTRTQIETIAPLPTVCANEATLTQVLANLLGNAIKFVPDGIAPQIRFWAEDRGEMIRLWLEDHGLGIPLDQHERIFRVFERLHGARYPGTGIGLSIVRKGVERMSGTVGFESVPGRGTKFWIELQKA
ncbi:MAG: PAS domain-containing protein [Verrucomicrobiota bacterium]